MFVDVTNLKKDGLCTFILVAAPGDAHPAPNVGAEGIQRLNLLLNKRYIIWLSVSLYNGSEFGRLVALQRGIPRISRLVLVYFAR